MDSATNIASHHAAYVDGSLSEDTGLENKMISLTLKVWEDDFANCVDKVQLAGTMLRSTRTFAPLYIQSDNKHYTALVKSISRQADAGGSVRTMDYEVQFECKPWLEGDTLHTVHDGAATNPITIDTDTVSRTISNGGWTPVTLYISGQDVTVSGYSSTVQCTGYLTISGAASQYIVYSDEYTVVNASGYNVLDQVRPIDFRLFVAPEKTSFYITGATWVKLEYYDRWYI
jgi:hypothetical protein